MRAIPGYPDVFATDAGQIFDQRPVPKHRRGHVANRGIRTPNSHNGYLAVGLPQKEFVHRLVCLAYHGLPEPGQCVRHLNGDPSDNRPSNLKWGSSQENAQDKVAHGRQNTQRLTAESVLEIRRVLGTPTTFKHADCLALAMQYGVTTETIFRAATRKAWKCV